METDRRLDEDAFVALMKGAFPNSTAAGLHRLFRKVDASADGRVDCHEFLDFLLSRESLTNTEPSSLGGGMMSRGSSSTGAFPYNP